MNKTTNIMIVGVGGQGVILASEIISLAALKEGLDVKKSEVHGMAQRGGSVVSNVRFGEKVHSPLISKGEANILLAFEKLEALRWVDHLEENSTIVTNTQRIDPLPVALGKAKYPADVLDKLKETNHKVISVDALNIARQVGNQKVINTVLLGALCKEVGISEESFMEALKERVPQGTIDINTTAFEKGSEKGVEL